VQRSVAADIKDSNNKILVIHNGRGETELNYFVADLGGTFGKVYGMPKIFRIFILKPDRNNPTAYAKTHMIDKVKDGHIRFHYSGKRSNLFKDIRVEDAQWIAGRLSQLSDRQIEDAFRAANYRSEEIRKLTQGLSRRQGCARANKLARRRSCRCPVAWRSALFCLRAQTSLYLLLRSKHSTAFDPLRVGQRRC
jgi:hypothetical protein